MVGDLGGQVEVISLKYLIDGIIFVDKIFIIIHRYVIVFIDRMN